MRKGSISEPFKCYKSFNYLSGSWERESLDEYFSLL